MSRIITSDESCVYSHNRETKQSLCSGRAAVSMTEESTSGLENNLFLFPYIRGIVHCKFLSQGHAVNAEYCSDVLRRLQGNIRHNDLNCGAMETGFSIMTKRCELAVSILQQQIASQPPRLAPCYFFLFPKMRFGL